MDWIGDLIRKALNELFGRCKCPLEIEKDIQNQPQERDNNRSNEVVDTRKFRVGDENL